MNESETKFWKNYEDKRYEILQEKERNKKLYGQKWRYWGKETNIINKSKKSLGYHISWGEENWERLNEFSCQDILEWGHLCNGVKSSKSHMPCLYPDWILKTPDKTFEVNGDHECLFWTEPLKSRPWVKLDCNHIYDYDCLLKILNNKWVSPQIDFNYLNCWWSAPISTDNEEIQSIIEEDRKLEVKAGKIATRVAKDEGLKKQDYSWPPYNGNFTTYSVSKIAVYQWVECKRPYNAGRREWGEPRFSKDECYCKECTETKLVKLKSLATCTIHSEEYIIFKCKFCWNQSSYFCWNTTHFWDECHKKQDEDPFYENSSPEKLSQCEGKEKCALGIDHPPNGTEEVPLYCLLCRTL